MSLIINTNVGSLTSQRYLGQTQAATQKLSAGVRINSAQDDAAGLAISDKLTSQINGMTQASQNANDGVSAIANLQSAIGNGNQSAARSRIQDVDMATEMSNISKNQILQQSSAAMLAQANASSSHVLSLLR
ncbi:hypothetical protein F6R98_15745 [Candidatus Methylospira mobilis]|uniref:Flagellin C-terminal domain-containing protein n=1 Tax=Candidatus Methylospira mobilis TaxID=1808979 RepID=A0A5Q0BJB9_9GAMM|nr:flagellin [Candidatus Methylospira mobilis]QFY43903.1 hypothetical protein F6R98_15745 [Candidatus Methylospira mobilis]WNV04906.1 flagellin [Candidatus Methylospira mobilis]